MPIRDATVNEGTMCPNRIVGKPGMATLQTCNDLTFFPSGRLMVRGVVAIHLFMTLTPSIIKIDVAPVSAIA